MSIVRDVIPLFVILFCGCKSNPYSTIYNLDFEYAGQFSKPTQWDTPDAVFHGYDTSWDSDQQQHGQSSLRMTQTDPAKSGWAAFYQEMSIAVAAGQVVELSGWIKTRDVHSGFADFYVSDPCQPDYDTMTHDTVGRGVRNSTEWTHLSVKKQFNTDVPTIEIGGILKGEGTAWFDNLELIVNGQKVADTVISAPKTQLTHKDKEELRKYIYPLQTFDSSDTVTTDLKVLDKLIGDCKVVALGENSHGSHEIFRMKDRLIRRLAINNGFDIFSIEAYMPESDRFNDYIRKGLGEAKNTVLQQQFWIWKTQEMVDMLSWMHDFYRSGQKITYTGIDMQAYDGSIAILKKAFRHNKSVKNLIEKIDSGLANILTYSSIGAPKIDPGIAKKLITSIALLNKYITESAAEGLDKKWLLQNTNLLLQYIRQGPYTWRDRCMANNLLWIKRQNPSSRIVVWAHNGHVEKCRGKMGGFLADSLGVEYVNFGFSFFNGKYTAIRRGSDQFIHEAQPAFKGTLEYLLEQMDESLFILDIKKIKSENSPIMAWIDDLRFRHVGAVKLENEFTDKSITDAFDYLIFIRESTPSNTLF